MLVRWIGLSFLFLVTGTAQAQEVDAARRFGTLPGVTQVSLSPDGQRIAFVAPNRSEEHTSELQSLMRISYAVFCLNKKILLILSFSSFIYLFFFSLFLPYS